MKTTNRLLEHGVNGKGDTLVIRVDGSVTSTVSGNTGEEKFCKVPFRYENDGIPYIGMGNGFTGGLLAFI